MLFEEIVQVHNIGIIRACKQFLPFLAFTFYVLLSPICPGILINCSETQHSVPGYPARDTLVQADFTNINRVPAYFWHPKSESKLQVTRNLALFGAFYLIGKYIFQLQMHLNFF